MSIVDVLSAAVAAQIGPASAWFADARRRAVDGSVAELLRAYTEASHHLGRAPLVLADAGAAVPAWPDVHTSHWTLEDAGRIVLLLARYEGRPGSADENAAAAIECYEQGDAREQESWLRAVALLPEPKRFLATVIDACRSSILPIFEAVACENPYPATYFPDRNFNQMVLKALFNGVALDRIVGLPARRNPELSRMAQDYAAERRAAGRSVPPDISLAMLDGIGAPRTDR